jgi:hypothetical protein
MFDRRLVHEERRRSTKREVRPARFPSIVVLAFFDSRLKVDRAHVLDKFTSKSDLTLHPDRNHLPGSCVNLPRIRVTTRVECEPEIAMTPRRWQF